MRTAPLSPVKVAVQIGFVVVIVAALLFGIAGTFDWPQAWWFVATFTIAMTISFAYLQRVNPEIIAVRQGVGEGTKQWDKPLLLGMLVALVAIAPVAALDIGRWDGTSLPIPAAVLGLVLFVGGFALTAWAQGVNRHFEPTVRIQSDRDHKVVDTGPYAHIRHPGYIAAAGLSVGMALALGSALALLPAAAAVALLALRTILEDRMLRNELPGYSDYANRVRFRWLPSIW
ncbi:MAG: methyltransferase [Pelagibacterium sp.]|uniref:isoprenylcysteine carboxylmethyltransferase family protein n=1 Tax=Pelagibacterium sp. TaxID=1967288 RepID=UPI0032EC8DED